jgi:hypothetical protein
MPHSWFLRAKTEGFLSVLEAEEEHLIMEDTPSLSYDKKLRELKKLERSLRTYLLVVETPIVQWSTRMFTVPYRYWETESQRQSHKHFVFDAIQSFLRKRLDERCKAVIPAYLDLAFALGKTEEALEHLWAIRPLVRPRMNKAWFFGFVDETLRLSQRPFYQKGDPGRHFALEIYKVVGPIDLRDYH